MKTHNVIKIYSLFILLFASVSVYAQLDDEQFSVSVSLPQIALIDIEPSFNNHIHFTLTPPSESGNSATIQQSSTTNLWINYSSSLSILQNSRSILAEISQGVFPSGIKLYVEASAYSGPGKGELGQSSGKTNISNQPRPIISSLGNCFTGDGINSGHSLNFSLEIDDFSKVHSINETNYTILYTITDN